MKRWFRPNPSLVGQTLLQARLRSEDGLTTVGLRRGRAIVGPDLLRQKLQVGDTLLLFGFWSEIAELRGGNRDLVLLNLPAEFDEVLPAPGRALQAVAALLVTVGMMVSGMLPNAHAALIGCLLMGLTGCVDLPSAYRAISWKSLVLIVGMLPFSVALQRTGASISRRTPCLRSPATPRRTCCSACSSSSRRGSACSSRTPRRRC
ncbi:SLC13 family permease [Dankookia sp. P2]|uniref:TrkA C-terminal domain-containing protein n=1 Tax=Dankookia sp. P2 TaxID=3423955 RepID=UPI003D674AA7